MCTSHGRCHQKWRCVEKPPAACNEESELAMVEGSLGTRWAMGQRQDGVVRQD